MSTTETEAERLQFELDVVKNDNTDLLEANRALQDEIAMLRREKDDLPALAEVHRCDFCGKVADHLTPHHSQTGQDADLCDGCYAEQIAAEKRALAGEVDRLRRERDRWKTVCKAATTEADRLRRERDEARAEVFATDGVAAARYAVDGSTIAALRAEVEAKGAEVERLRGLILKGFELAEDSTEHEFEDWKRAIHRAALDEEGE